MISEWVDVEIKRYEKETVDLHIRYLGMLVMFHQDYIDTRDITASPTVQYLMELTYDTRRSAWLRHYRRRHTKTTSRIYRKVCTENSR